MYCASETQSVIYRSLQVSVLIKGVLARFCELALRRAWARTMSLRIMVVRATLVCFPELDELGVFCFQVRIEANRDERWHVERLSQSAPPPRMKARPV